MATDLDSLRAAVAAAPGDTTARLVLAEALDDAGNPLAAAHQRIVADPANDFWRLALADVMERMPETRVKCPRCVAYEKIDHVLKHRMPGSPLPQRPECLTCNGTGTIPDPTPKLRAELARVQVELGQLPVCFSHCHARIDYRCRTCATNARERNLLTALRGTLPKCLLCRGGMIDPSYGERSCPTCSGTGRAGQYVRGIVEDVRVPRMADVWERRCKVCGCDEEESGQRGNGCARCDGGRVRDWRPTQAARDLFAAHPSVLRVWCGDRVPYHFVGDSKRPHGWHSDAYYRDIPRTDDLLPGFILSRLPGEESDGDHARYYDTPGDARLALAHATADALREACGA